MFVILNGTAIAPLTAGVYPGTEQLIAPNN
jgi:hypothetical protein